MKKIIGYLGKYWKMVDKRVLLLSALFSAIAIFINYQYGFDAGLKKEILPVKLFNWYILFLTAFSFPYFLLSLLRRQALFSNKRFLALLLLAPALFAFKMSVPLNIDLSGNEAANVYWNAILYFPLKLLALLFFLWIIWKVFDNEQAFYGTELRQFSSKPYWCMLLIMLPLIALASTQPDFLAMYPKYRHFLYLQGGGKAFYKLIYELSYGTDFISIEFFFRGFLVLAFAKWAGRDAILPMAVFYCTIHFGKPLGECISSFFGGLLLGVVTYHTRTILGGLMVHLGIAWLMELGGWIGNAM